MGLRPVGVEYPSFNKFSDEGGKASDRNLLNLIRNNLAYNQFDYFMRNKSEGLSQVGMERLNQSIKAYSRISEGIQSEDLSKITCGSGDKKTSGVAEEIKLNDVYGKRYRIPIDHDILDDHGVFFPRALSDELVFEMRLAPAGMS